MTEPRHIIRLAINRIRDAVERFNPLTVVALFSGGHDSVTATMIAHQAGADSTLHVNTGIGIEQTRRYVRETCALKNWNLKEYKAVENTKQDGTPNPMVYDDMVRRFGFPGPWQHKNMYRNLKKRQLERFERDIKCSSGRPVLYVSGERSDESSRRKRNLKNSTYSKKNRVAFVAPIHDFTKSDCHDCMEHFGIKRNEVVDLIHKSGECLCGAYATPSDFNELKTWFPEMSKRIEDLEREVMPRFPWRWQEHPPAWFKEKKQGQTFMFDYDQPLCHRCNQLQTEA